MSTNKETVNELVLQGKIKDVFYRDNVTVLTLAVGIEPWIGASITQGDVLEACIKNGARLVTTNNPGDIIEKIEKIVNKKRKGEKQ